MQTCPANAVISSGSEHCSPTDYATAVIHAQQTIPRYSQFAENPWSKQKQLAHSLVTAMLLHHIRQVCTILQKFPIAQTLAWCC